MRSRCRRILDGFHGLAALSITLPSNGGFTIKPVRSQDLAGFLFVVILTAPKGSPVKISFLHYNLTFTK